MSFGNSSERITSVEGKETGLLKKHGLFAGRKVVFEKISKQKESTISVGAKIEGFLDADVRIGQSIQLDNNKSTISNVKGVEEKDADLYITTNTSVYKLVYDLNDIEGVETAKGSQYRYLEDGTTQRFKKVEGKNYKPQAVLVYVPDFEWIKNHASPEMLTKLGEDKITYEENLLEYVQDKVEEDIDAKTYVVNKEGDKIESNKEIQDTKDGVFLAFCNNKHANFMIPVFIVPKIGFLTYDSIKYRDEETGELMRERHLGNRVVRIIRKGENF